MQSLLPEPFFNHGAGQSLIQQRPGIRLLWPLNTPSFADIEQHFMTRRSAMMARLADFVNDFHQEFSASLSGDAHRHSPVLSQRALPAPPRVSTLQALELKDTDKFELVLDVRDFSLEDLTVKLVGGKLVVAGLMERKAPSGDEERKEFTRELDLPRGINLGAITCSLTEEGLLKVEAPPLQPDRAERTVPIRFRTSLSVPIAKAAGEGEEGRASS
ncbi:heat shock protein beta-9 [Polypterus senegalus]